MVTEADWDAWQPDDLRPIRATMSSRSSGRPRLMFGSDWPVCLLAASYQQVFDAARATLAGLTATTRCGGLRRDRGRRLSPLG